MASGVIATWGAHGNMLRITLFAAFSLVSDDSPVAGCSSGRLQSLLAYLLLHRHAPQPRHHIAYVLWPDVPEDRARSSLRNLVYQLRNALPLYDSCVAADSRTLQWRFDAPCTLDVADFEAALKSAGHSPENPVKRYWLEVATSLYKGDLLPGNYDEWLTSLRYELRQRFERALIQLAELCEQTEDFQAALPHAQRYARFAPLDEANTIRLMRLYARHGDRTGVQRAYDQCATALSAELGLQPAPATQQAYSQYLREAAMPAAVSSSPAQPKRRPPALPRPIASLVGREHELTQITRHLKEPDCRLLNIVGPGGMGKTRLALAAAHELQSCFAQGAAFVTAVAVADAANLPQALADGLELAYTGRTSIEQQLMLYLADKEMLLVLDNLEHLPSAGELLMDLLSGAPALKLIVTSRGRLHLPQEWVLDLEGLPIPTEAGEWTKDSAATLFLQRARRVKMSFAPTPDDRRAILAICRLVDGVPLALELAANWVRLLSVSEIAAEISRDLDFLTAPAPVARVVERHRSLRVVFDHSWRLLSPVEQRLLGRLSLFRGGFTRDAARVVADLPADVPILPLLVSLIDKSLLRRTSERRYDLHELIRQYAAAHLNSDPGEAGVALECYAAYYLSWLQTTLPRLRSSEQREMLREIGPELNNIRAAWDWAVAHSHLSLLKESAWVIWYYFDLRNMYGEFVGMFVRAEEAILRAKDSANSNQTDSLAAQCDNAVCHLRIWRAFSGLRLGHVTEMRDLMQDSLTILRRQGDLAGLGDGLWVHGILSWLSGDFEVAAADLQESLEVNQALQRPWQVSFAYVLLGAVRHEQGGYNQAYELLGQGLAQSRRLGVPRNTVFALGLLARTTTALGRPEEVTQLMHENLRLATEMEDYSAMAYALENLGLALQAAGQLGEAWDHFQRAIAYHSEIADAWSASRTLSYAGQLALLQGDIREARRCFAGALRTAMEAEFHPYAVDALLGLAEVARREENLESAHILATHVLQHPAGVQAAKDRARLLLSELEKELTPAQLALAREQARALSFDDLVKNALAGAAN